MFCHADVVCLCLGVHAVSNFNAELCITCILLMLVDDAMDEHM